MAQANPAYVVHAVRTPIGKYRGALAKTRPDDLAAHLITALAARQPALFQHLDHVVLGATTQAGEDNRNVARMALLLAGAPSHQPAGPGARLCGPRPEPANDPPRRIPPRPPHLAS